MNNIHDINAYSGQTACMLQADVLRRAVRRLLVPRRLVLSLLVVLATAGASLLGGPSLVGEAGPLQQTAPSLGSAASFAVLGGSAVTNTGATIVNGDLGVSPGSAVTGFPPGIVVGGSIHATDALAAQAQVSATTAYNSLAGQPCTADLTSQDLGGMTLTPGVYCFSSPAQLTGTLTLNALGIASSVFVFKIGSTLTTASASSVLMINGGSPCNVFWQVGSSATLGSTTAFQGSIIALTSITLNTGARVSGRALARNGAVTLDTNTFASVGCVAGVATATPTSTATATATATSAATATAAAATAAAATATSAAAAAATATAGSTGGGSVGLPAVTAVPTNTRTATETAVPTAVPATAVPATAVPAATALPASTPVPAPLPAVVAAPVTVQGVAIPPSTPIDVVALPEGTGIDSGIVVLPPGTVVDVPEIGIVVLEEPVPVQIPADASGVVPAVPPAQASPPSRATPPIGAFPRTGTGSALPSVSPGGASSVPFVVALALAVGAFALSGAGLAWRRRPAGRPAGRHAALRRDGA